MKTIAFSLLFAFFALNSQAQKFICKSGYIKFYSHTPVEDIEAENNQVASILNTENGEIQVNLLVRSFTFKKELMQEHFNENYMESSTYPKSTFKGKISEIEKVNFKKDGIYNVNVTGEITVHGVTKPFSTSGKIEIKKGIPTVKSQFILHAQDFNIEIPDMVKEKIAKDIEVTLDIKYE